MNALASCFRKPETFDDLRRDLRRTSEQLERHREAITGGLEKTQGEIRLLLKEIRRENQLMLLKVDKALHTLTPDRGSSCWHNYRILARSAQILLVYFIFRL